MTAEQTISKATAMLLFTEPFYATILLQLKRVSVGDDVCEVMAVDGEHLFFNPKGMATLSFDEVKTVLMHEAAHIAYLHHVRMVGKDPELSNIAADHAVNLVLSKAGYPPVKGWLCDKRFDGFTFEKNYAILERERQQKQKGSGGQAPPPQQQNKPQRQGGNNPTQKPNQNQQNQQNQGKQPGNGKAAKTPGGMGQIIPCKPTEKVDQAEKWKLAVEQAAAAAKAAGRLPAHLQKLVEQLREAKVAWKDVLRQFVSDQVPADFTWSRPNRRLISQGIYMPSVKKEGLGRLVFSFDFSGSCTAQAEPFASEVAAVHEDLKPESLVLLCHDTRVHPIGEFGPGEDLEFKFRGGGGTDFRPVFDYVNQLDPAPRALVMLTDLYGPLPTEEPPYPVLFVCTSDMVAPFGQTVKMEE